MDTYDQSDVAQPGTPAPGTLGHVLYSNRGRPLVDEVEWVVLVRRVAAGEQPALHALYERAHRVVFTVAVRITGCRENAEEVTLDVFHDIWRRAWAYDPANGTVLGWIMNQARSRSIDRLRFERRQKRVDPGAEDVLGPAEAPDPRDLLELKQQGSAVSTAMGILTPHERQAVHASFFSGLTHAEAAAQLDEPLGTIKTRIRAALRKLRRALNEESRREP